MKHEKQENSCHISSIWTIFTNHFPLYLLSFGFVAMIILLSGATSQSVLYFFQFHDFGCLKLVIL